jgi:hypothetical protein
MRPDPILEQGLAVDKGYPKQILTVKDIVKLAKA